VTATSSRSTPRANERGTAAGARAEALAAKFLEARGLTIVARNYRTRRGEIDLIARDRGTLVFVEVRRRRSVAFGGAAASITASKRARLIAAAQAYLATLPREPACRFDAVLIDGATTSQIEWQCDVFGTNGDC
jgi:putative endonuclease